MKKNKKEILPNITDENEQEYWIEFKKTSSPHIREAMIIKYAPLVKYAAARIHTGNIKGVDFEDLVGFGSFGLLDAIDRYDPNRDIKFKTYALTRIQGSIYDELRKIDVLPRSVRKGIKDIQEVTEVLELKLKRKAQPQEIADILGIPLAKYNEIMGYNIQASTTSLSEVWYLGDDSDEISIIDTLKSSYKNNPEYQAERDEVQKEIVKALKNLPQNEQEVLILYYWEELTLKEIGKVLSVSESRVSQIHTKAIQGLRYSLQEIKKSLL